MNAKAMASLHWMTGARRAIPALPLRWALASWLLLAGLGAGSGVDAAPQRPASCRTPVPVARVPAGPPQHEPQLAAAAEALRERRVGVAYGRFAALADLGQPGAALMALSLVLQGAEVYGVELSATPGQLRRWGELARCELQLRGPTIARAERAE